MNINNLNYRPPISYNEPNKQESRTMTRKELVREINLILEKYVHRLDVIEIKALNMAIEALEREPCDDCISRERLRESLKKELAIVNNNEMYWQGWHDCTVAVETRITDAPSVVPKGSDEQ